MKNQLTIIAGQYRSRKITFLDSPGLRPTPNRVRETLFNWVNQTIRGSNCLDLFAGSGALGFEAASRHAAHVTMVEKNRSVFSVIKETKSNLECVTVELINMTAAEYIQGTQQQFDLVFLDPPFNTDLLQQSYDLLLSSHCLRSGAMVYVEHERDKTIEIPKGWAWHRQKKSGDVVYGLLEKTLSE